MIHNYQLKAVSETVWWLPVAHYHRWTRHQQPLQEDSRTATTVNNGSPFATSKNQIIHITKQTINSNQIQKKITNTVEYNNY